MSPVRAFCGHSVPIFHPCARIHPSATLPPLRRCTQVRDAHLTRAFISGGSGSITCYICLLAMEAAGVPQESRFIRRFCENL
ncbi:Hypp5133 [Branchiostoma lanceolatum]|uniref:Hypp5133 protein n=1 Tax=Branchiostoma lanceolatum TaxID=7740 RepID=A0A8K0AGE4_BRALA|nr:Hypp5133 [Branchiostoma lanceolatum]